jgi:hypothetical protein
MIGAHFVARQVRTWWAVAQPHLDALKRWRAGRAARRTPVQARAAAIKESLVKTNIIAVGS